MTKRLDGTMGAYPVMRAARYALLFITIAVATARESCAIDILEFDSARAASTFAIHPVSGEFYTVEADRIGIYDSSGALLRAIQNPPPRPRSVSPRIRVNNTGHVMVVDDLDDLGSQGVKLFDSAGDLAGTIPDVNFSTPAGFAPDGRVFIGRRFFENEISRDRIDVYSPHGNLEDVFFLPTGSPRNGLQFDVGADGLLYALYDRFVQPSGLVRSVDVVGLSGEFQRNIPIAADLTPGATLNPTRRALRIAPNGNLLIARDGTHIDVYDPQGVLVDTVYSGLNPRTDFDVTPSGGLALREFQNGSRIRVFTQEETAQLTPTRALRHFVDGPFGWARSLGATHPGGVIGENLDLIGIGANNAASETTATMFRVPGEVGVPQNIAVTWKRVIGGLDSFGIFDPTTIAIDPSANPRQYAEAALRSGRVLFRRSDLPTLGDFLTVTKQVELIGGSTVAFFFTGPRTSTYEAFLSNPTVTMPPFLSISEANPGAYDQMVAFAANGRTLLGFEDLTPTITRDDADMNLSDELFSFNVQLIAVPEPAGVVLLLTGMLAGCSRRSAVMS